MRSWSWLVYWKPSCSKPYYRRLRNQCVSNGFFSIWHVHVLGGRHIAGGKNKVEWSNPITMKIINYEINKTTFDVYACWSVVFHVCRSSVYLARNILTRHRVGSFILQWNFVCHVVRLPSVWILQGASTICLDLPSVFLSGKDLQDPVDGMVVCLYSHQQLAFSEPYLLAIIA